VAPPTLGGPHCRWACCGAGAVGVRSSSKSSSATSSASSSGTSSSPASTPTGTPIKTMTITSLNSQGPVYPNIAITAKAYEKWINAHGGIAGHPLQVTVCDEHGKPTDAAACARQAAADQSVAVVAPSRSSEPTSCRR